MVTSGGPTSNGTHPPCCLALAQMLIGTLSWHLDQTLSACHPRVIGLLASLSYQPHLQPWSSAVCVCAEALTSSPSVGPHTCSLLWPHKAPELRPWSSPQPAVPCGVLSSHSGIVGRSLEVWSRASHSLLVTATPGSGRHTGSRDLE